MKNIFGIIFLLAISGLMQGCTSDSSALKSCGENCVELGRYPSETDGSPRNIEWLVIGKEADGSMVLISKYGLDCLPYHGKRDSVTWETSDIRKWLNTEFLINAFTKEEQAMLVETVLKNEDNVGQFTEADVEYVKKWKAEEPVIEGLKELVNDKEHNSWNTPGGNDTTDKVWLLSISDLEKYGFDTDQSRMVKPLPLVRDRLGNICGNLYDVCDELNVADNYAWWLRSPGFMNSTATDVWYDGDIDHDGLNVENGLVAIRPVIKIKPAKK